MSVDEVKAMLNIAKVSKRELDWLTEEYKRVENWETERSKEIRDTIADATSKYINARLWLVDKLAKMPEAQRDVLHYVYIEAESVAIAADHACVSYGYARNIVSKAAELILERCDKM